VDKRLLGLAVANTNLKAARLSAREGAAALDRLVDTLTEMERTGRRTGDDSHVVAGIRSRRCACTPWSRSTFPAADDAEMTRLEQQMHALGGEVEGNLCPCTGEQPAVGGTARGAASQQAWSDYPTRLVEVLRLSRENTNVISVRPFRFTRSAT